MTRLEDVIELLKQNPGLSEREITDHMYGTNQPRQPINGICRRLAGKNLIVRRDRRDDILRNYLANDATSEPPAQVAEPEDQQSPEQSEDQTKHMLKDHLN